MLIYVPRPRWTIKLFILMVLRDSGQRIRMVSDESNSSYPSYNAYEWVNGECFEMVAPNWEEVQLLPAALSGFLPLRHRLVARLLRRYRRLTSGKESGTFDLSVGPEHTVAVKYVVRWNWRVVSEIDIEIPKAPELAEIAGAELDRLRPPDDGIDA